MFKHLRAPSSSIITYAGLAFSWPAPSRPIACSPATQRPQVERSAVAQRTIATAPKSLESEMESDQPQIAQECKGRTHTAPVTIQTVLND